MIALLLSFVRHVLCCFALLSFSHILPKATHSAVMFIDITVPRNCLPHIVMSVSYKIPKTSASRPQKLAILFITFLHVKGTKVGEYQGHV
jgi:hypothetical protein